MRDTRQNMRHSNHQKTDRCPQGAPPMEPLHIHESYLSKWQRMQREVDAFRLHALRARRRRQLAWAEEIPPTTPTGWLSRLKARLGRLFRARPGQELSK